MKLQLMSDLHGHLPPVKPCDVVVIAGDVMHPQHSFSQNSPASLTNQARWVHTNFYPWLKKLSANHVVFTPGNHDWLWMYPELVDEIGGKPENYHCLIDEGVELDGVKFWGTPWQPTFFNWAFNLSEDELTEKWGLVPDDTDVLVTHGPPYGVCDKVGTIRVGSTSQLAWLQKRLPEELIVVCGHIHIGRGYGEVYNKDDGRVAARVYNVALVDEQCNLRHEPVEVEL